MSELERVLALLRDAEDDRDHWRSLCQSSSSQPPSSSQGGSPLRRSEEQALRSKFSAVAGEGGEGSSIGVAQLEALHRKLGEPLLPGEAAAAVAAVGVSGALSFAAFLGYWLDSHRLEVGEGGSSAEQREARRRRYFARFQLQRHHQAAPGTLLQRVYTEECQAPCTLEWRLHFYTDVAGVRTQVSPWHDIPLMNEDGTLNMVVEIPRWTRRKMEIATQEPFNPIKQDVKHGKLREIEFGDQLFNYGAFPQTWESPKNKSRDPATGTETPGDNDPIDAVEVGVRQHKCGSILKVKVLGILGFIDDEETDWKVLVLAVDDPLASRVHTLEDLQREVPGAWEAERQYLRDYKPGKQGSFMFGGQAQGEVFAKQVVAETHEAWKRLMAGQEGELAAGCSPTIKAEGLVHSSQETVAALAAAVGAPGNATELLGGSGSE